MGKPIAKYNDDDLVMDIARGNLSYRAIAGKHQISESSVARIARGTQRPELQKKIQAASEAMIDRVRRLGTRTAALAMMRLGRIVSPASKAAAETQRKAAVDILKFAIGDFARPEITQDDSKGPELSELSQKTRELILTELEGPEAD